MQSSSWPWTSSDLCTPLVGVPLLLHAESRVPETILVFVIPATIDVKVGGLVAAATDAVFSHKFQK